MNDFSLFTELDDRARRVFVSIVESYLKTGEPVGSRFLSKGFDVSPATIRNVMSDLEDLGLLHSPHVSAGRLPSDMGLKYFVDGLLEVGTLGDNERAALEAEYRHAGSSTTSFYEQTGRILSDLSASAGLVVAPKEDRPLRHIEFRLLNERQALAVIVPINGAVENRIMDVQPGTTPDMLHQASLFLSERLHGASISQMRDSLKREIAARRHELGEITTGIIESGLAIQARDGTFIVRGTSNLLNEESLQNLEHVRLLMQNLERQETAVRLLDEAGQAKGVKIFIGADNPVFQESGYSLILSPYRDAQKNIVGALGVIGPKRLDYAKIIPSINAMAEILGRRMSQLTP